MKVIISGRTKEAKAKLLKWGKDPKNHKDGYLSGSQWIEEYKTTAIDFMIEQTAKRLKIPKGLITRNQIHERTVINKLTRKASKKLDIDKNSLIVVVEE